MLVREVSNAGLVATAWMADDLLVLAKACCALGGRPLLRGCLFACS